MLLRSFTSALALGIATIAVTGPASAQSNQVESQFELAFWQAVATSEDKAQYEAYLAKYPNGTFSTLAKLKIAASTRTAASVPVSPPVVAFAGSSMGSGSSSLSSGGSSYTGSSMGGGSTMGGGGSSGSSYVGSSSVGGSSSAGGGGSGSSGSLIGNGSGSSNSAFGSSSMASSSMSSSNSSSGVSTGNSPAGSTPQPQSNTMKLLGAAFSIGSALMANKQNTNAQLGSSSGSSVGFGSSSGGGSGSGSSSSSAQPTSGAPKSGAQGLLGQLMPIAGTLAGNKLGVGSLSATGSGQQSGTTAMLVNTVMQLVMPNRPSLSAVATPNLPSSFCSADARNTFYEGVFKPAMAKADRNNNDAIGYMQVLQQLYDAAGQKKDSAKMNSFSSEAQSFASVASQTHSERLNFNSLFSQLMGVPLGRC